MDGAELAQLREAVDTAIAHAEAMLEAVPEERALERILACLCSAQDELVLLTVLHARRSPVPLPIAAAIVNERGR
jgi:hypothetical protein